MKACSKTRDTQDTDRVLAECITDMAQGSLRNILAAAAGIDNMALRVGSHRIDREVAAREILFERHVRAGIDLETAVTGSGFFLGAGERVFFAGFRVQEDREAAADPAVAQCLEFIRRRADDDPVALARRQAEKPVAYCAADEIYVHHFSMFALWGACKIFAGPSSSL